MKLTLVLPWLLLLLLPITLRQMETSRHLSGTHDFCSVCAQRPGLPQLLPAGLSLLEPFLTPCCGLSLGLCGWATVLTPHRDTTAWPQQHEGHQAPPSRPSPARLFCYSGPHKGRCPGLATVTPKGRRHSCFGWALGRRLPKALGRSALGPRSSGAQMSPPGHLMLQAQEVTCYRPGLGPWCPG